MQRVHPCKLLSGELSRTPNITFSKPRERVRFGLLGHCEDSLIWERKFKLSIFPTGAPGYKAAALFILLRARIEHDGYRSTDVVSKETALSVRYLQHPHRSSPTSTAT